MHLEKRMLVTGGADLPAKVGVNVRDLKDWGVSRLLEWQPHCSQRRAMQWPILFQGGLRSSHGYKTPVQAIRCLSIAAMNCRQ